MVNTDVRMVEMIYSDFKDTDKFKRFLKLSKNILNLLQSEEQNLINEIHWINENFMALINELSVLNDDKYKNSLLDMAIAEMKLLLNCKDVYDIAFNFIELVINIDNKVKYLTNKQMSENLENFLNGFQYFEKYTQLERVG